LYAYCSNVCLIRKNCGFTTTITLLRLWSWRRICERSTCASCLKSRGTQ